MLAEPVKPVTYVLQPRGKPLYEDEDSFGMRMLTKMGWNKDKGLGAKEDGSKDFIRVRYKNSSSGMGFEDKDSQWTEHEDKFSQLLESLKDGGSEEDAGNRESLEEKSKKSRARVHYKKFTRGKDLSQYSEKDLANIFGRKTLKAEKKEEEDEAEEDCPSTSNFGVQSIISKISSAEYFKKKMSSSGSLSTSNKEGDPEDTGKKSKKKRKRTTEEDRVLPVEEKETPMEGKKIKKKRKKMVDEEFGNLCEPSGQESVKHQTQEDQEKQETGDVQEFSVEKKNKKKKIQDVAGQFQGSEVQEGEQSKKKRRKNKGEAPESVQQSPEDSLGEGFGKDNIDEVVTEFPIEIPLEIVTEEFKPKKKKRKNKEEAPESVQQPPEDSVGVGVRKDKIDEKATVVPIEISSDSLTEELKLKKKRRKIKEEAPKSVQHPSEDSLGEGIRKDKIDEEVTEIPIEISSDSLTEEHKPKKKRRKTKEGALESVQKFPEEVSQENSRKDKSIEQPAEAVNQLSIEISSEMPPLEPKPKKKRKLSKEEARGSLEKSPEKEILQQSSRKSKKAKKHKESEVTPAEGLSSELQEALKAYSPSGEVIYKLPLQRCDALLNLNSGALKGSNFSSIIGYRLSEKIDIQLIELCKEAKDEAPQESGDPKNISK